MDPVIIVIIAVAIVTGIVAAYGKTSGNIPSQPKFSDAVMLLGTGLPLSEDQAILSVSQSFNIDPRLLASIRKAEMGGPGREFGVLLPGLDTYQLQAEGAARTIARTLIRYEQNIGPVRLDDHGRYSSAFVLYLAYGGPGYSGWAPVSGVGATPVGEYITNDPNGLNRNWLGNVEANYSVIGIG